MLIRLHACNSQVFFSQELRAVNHRLNTKNIKEKHFLHFLMISCKKCFDCKTTLQARLFWSHQTVQTLKKCHILWLHCFSKYPFMGKRDINTNLPSNTLNILFPFINSLKLNSIRENPYFNGLTEIAFLQQINREMVL